MTIPNTLFYDPRPQFEDANGEPLDLGSTLTFYSAGTTTLKNIYADSTLDTPLDNPLTLDAGGYVPEGGVWLAEGAYKLVVKNSLGATEWTQDNIAGAGGSGGGSAFSTVESIEELRAITVANAGLTYVQGYYGAGTGGNKFFYWDESSTATDDGGSVIAPQGTPATGRFIALWACSSMTLYDWGCRTGSLYSNASAIENMISFVNLNPQYEIICPKGDWYLNGTVDFNGDIKVTIQDDCSFNGTTGIHVLTLSCKTLNIETTSNIAVPVPSNLLSLVITSNIDIDPRWYGAVESDTTLSTTYFNDMLGKIGTNRIKIATEFAINNCDFTGFTLVKDLDGILYNKGTAIFDEIIAEGAFIGDELDGLVFLRSEVNGNWFAFDPVVDVAEYSNLMTSLATNGSKHVTWYTGTYEFTSIMTNEDTFAHTYDIKPEVLFKATGFAVNMPAITSNAHCIDNTGTGSFVFKQDVRLTWFGANTNDASSTQPALAQAVKTGSFITGEGSIFPIDTELSVVGYGLYLKDMTLAPVSNAGYTGASVITADSAINMQNVFIDGSSNFNIKALISSASSVDLIFKDCKFVGGGNDITGTLNKVSIFDTDFTLTWSILLIQESVRISRCDFSRLIVWDPDAVVIDNCNILGIIGGYSITFVSIITTNNDKILNVIQNNYFDSSSTPSFFQLTKTDGTQVIGTTDPLDLEYWGSVPLKMLNNTGTFQATDYVIKNTVSVQTAGTFDVPLVFPSGYDRQYLAEYYTTGKHAPGGNGNGASDIQYFEGANPQEVTLRYTVAVANAGSTQDIYTITGREERYNT